MPEALNNRYNPVQPNFEVKRRDEREEAAKISKRISESKLDEESRQRTEKNVQRREEIRSTSEADKRETLQESTLRREEKALEKRRPQDKTNPDSGNIINVIV
jgi:hypothetical protein